jgi:hypothetical protein
MISSEKKINSLWETDSDWKSLHVIGGVCSLLMVAIILGQFVVFLSAPPPLEGTAADWFALFQQNKFMGLLAFELLMVVYVILSVPLALALYAALHRTDQSFAAIYLALSLVGAMSFIAARPAFEMLALSGQYAAATTDAQKFVFLAAGETLVAVFHGTTFQVSYILGSINGLILSMIMLKSNLFGKATAYARIASSVLDFGLFVPTIGLYLSLLSVFALLIWNILVALRLLRLGRES